MSLGILSETDATIPADSYTGGLVARLQETRTEQETHKHVPTSQRTCVNFSGAGLPDVIKERRQYHASEQRKAYVTRTMDAAAPYVAGAALGIAAVLAVRYFYNKSQEEGFGTRPI